MSYSPAFFDQIDSEARASASVVLPPVVDLVKPRRVIDVGCARGGWLSVALTLGAEEIFGIDGPHVDAASLVIPRDRFMAWDLEKPLTPRDLPTGLSTPFDLAICVETGEHLSAAMAAPLVKALTEFAPTVLFSAAVPGQGGTHHVNEQWPAYWAALFAERGYVCLDCLRAAVWEKIPEQWWFAQNALLFVRKDVIEGSPRLRELAATTGGPPRALVHPGNYLRKVKPLTLRGLARSALGLIRRRLTGGF